MLPDSVLRVIFTLVLLWDIAQGTALYQLESDAEPRLLKAGEAFYEPADTVIAHFDNASDTEPMRFIAYYLLDGDQELIHLLES